MNLRLNLCGLAFLWLAFSTSIAQAQSTGETFVPSNSVWRFFRGTNEASSPAVAWRTNTFDDSSWEVGPAPFYFGTTYTNSVNGTLLADMQSNYTCIFLRGA